MKTKKTLFMGCYDFNDGDPTNWLHFVRSSPPVINMVKIEDYFRKVIYKAEYGEPLAKHEQVEVYAITELYDYDDKKVRKIIFR